MASGAAPPALRWVSGEVVAKATTARLIVPTSGISTWEPFTRIVETIATTARQPPPHAHEMEEVLTYMFEGYADYQPANEATVSLPPGSVCLLSAFSKVSHRISPSQGSTVRWVSLVLNVPPGTAGQTRTQIGNPAPSELQPDGSILRDLVGPGSSLASSVGLSAREVRFGEAGTAFQRVGHGRRGFVYALTGRGAVDSQPLEAGEGVLIEGASGVALHGQRGFCVVLGSAPTAQ